MGGEALVRALRAWPELEGVPIVVLTAKADDELRVRLLREGVQDYLTKPVVLEELRARLDNVVTLKRTRDVLQGAVSSQSRDLTALADQLAAANRTKDEFWPCSRRASDAAHADPHWATLIRARDGSRDASVGSAIGLERRLRRASSRTRWTSRGSSRASSGEPEADGGGSVVHAAIDSLRPATDTKGLQLDAVVDAEPAMVSGTRAAPAVVWNLLSNASSSAAAAESGSAGADGGPRAAHGRRRRHRVDPAMLPRLFDRFWQADSSMTRAHGGLGSASRSSVTWSTCTAARCRQRGHGSRRDVHRHAAGARRAGSLGRPRPPEVRPRRPTGAAAEGLRSWSSTTIRIPTNDRRGAGVRRDRTCFSATGR